MPSPNNDVGICNGALSLLHQPPITSIASPNNTASAICALWYDQTREEVLQFHTWNFAIKRANIAEDAIKPSYGWSHRYRVPSDYLRFMSIDGNDSTGSDINIGLVDNSRRYDYTLEDSFILVNETFSAGMNLRYISDVEQVGAMTALFKRAFMHQLALNMAYGFTENQIDVQRLQSIVQNSVSEAMAIDGQERPPRRIESSKWNTVRRSLYRSNTATDRLGYY